MIILVNGVFGVGKTTVAESSEVNAQSCLSCRPGDDRLRLKALPRWVPLDGRVGDDYQHCPLWRYT